MLSATTPYTVLIRLKHRDVSLVNFRGETQDIATTRLPKWEEKFAPESIKYAPCAVSVVIELTKSHSRLAREIMSFVMHKPYANFTNITPKALAYISVIPTKNKTDGVTRHSTYVRIQDPLVHANKEAIFLMVIEVTETGQIGAEGKVLRRCIAGIPREHDLTVLKSGLAQARGVMNVRTEVYPTDQDSAYLMFVTKSKGPSELPFPDRSKLPSHPSTRLDEKEPKWTDKTQAADVREALKQTKALNYSHRSKSLHSPVENSANTIQSRSSTCGV